MTCCRCSRPAPRVTRTACCSIGGCRADVLAAEHGTPVLVVSETALRARAREYAAELTARWPRSRVVFASKAFPCTAVQRVMVEEGLGLDVAGGGEIVTAIKAGADPALLVLHGNAKTRRRDRDGGRARDRPRRRRQRGRRRPARGDGAPGRTQDVLVRIIPGVTADTHAHVLTGHESSKFGLAPAAAAKLIRRIESIPQLRMRGLHVHVGSQILAVEPFVEAVRAVGRARRVPRLRPRRRARRALHVRRRAAVGRELPRRARRRGPRAPARRVPS